MESGLLYEERALLTLLKQSDTDAYLELYNRYHQPLYGFILRYVKLPSLAEDLLQDVFLKLWEVRHRIDPDLCFSAYLYRIARNRVYKMLKRMAADEQLRPQLLAQFPLSAERIENRVEWREYERLLHSAINQLPPQRRRVFTLCRQQGKSYEQVAEELAISRNTVKEHMSLAMRAIRDYVGRHGGVSLGTYLLLVLLEG